ncbi:YaiI/YqxD family protein [Microvirga rosea]|uniref:YaiI/YqxD family protein n=1 Tax=Microvirga rosea TaxID=2715425 RepID=UPI001D09AC57|nr:YaiI/YqxD family protein [Microvirga rosea]MCB8819149.1 YaiI/YqxD family protein [Microvirga rosea]
MNPTPEAIEIYVDADACPVKAEIYRVAERHRVKVFVVANSFLMVPQGPLFERVVVGDGFDAADDWIADHVRRGMVVVTADIPLAHRCVKAGADVIGPTGKPFTEASVGMALATRNLMEDLRAMGEVSGGPRPFSAKDRSAFLSALDLAIVRLKRAGFRAGAP